MVGLPMEPATQNFLSWLSFFSVDGWSTGSIYKLSLFGSESWPVFRRKMGFAAHLNSISLNLADTVDCHLAT
jgi:hypothetical protein